MSNLDALSVSARLEENKTLGTLFDILREYGDATAAKWLKGDAERSCTFSEMTRRADDYASALMSQAPEGSWMAIAVDTCPEWPSLFWGVMRSGHNALLLDASASDEMLQGLLDEAGCRMIITR